MLRRTSSRPAAEVRAITILGATGSIGASTLDLIKRAPERYRVEVNQRAAQRGGTRQKSRARSARAMPWLRIRPPIVSSKTRFPVRASKRRPAKMHWSRRRSVPADWVMAAISGSAGLKPTLAAIERGATVALANKECLVCAGSLFMRRAATTGATVLPVDSEHNAVFQALGAGNRADVRRAILTASGGPFRTWSKEAIKAATPGAGVASSELVDGPKSHDRFRNAHEQGS